MPAGVLADLPENRDAPPASELTKSFKSAVLDLQPERALALLREGAGLPADKDLRVRAMTLAVETGNVALVKALVESGLEIALVDEKELLHSAAGSGFTEVVQVLLDLGANPNASDEELVSTALGSAAFTDRPEIVRILLKAGAKVNVKDYSGDTALQKAAKYGHTEVVEILRAAGANSKGVEASLLYYAARVGRLDLLKSLLESGTKPDVLGWTPWTALMKSAGEGHVEVARELLRAGADPNFKTKGGDTALLSAVEGGHLEMAELLLEAGADINARSGEHSVLTLAAQTGLHSIVKRFLQEAGPSGRDRQHLTMALGAACGKGHAEVVKTLIAAGANPKYRDTRSGWTFLMDAARSGSVETVRALIEAGADLNGKDKTIGKTPAGHAAEAGDAEIFKLLEEAGAKVTKEDRKELFFGAAAKGRLATVSALLEGGMNVNARDRAGMTAVMIAAKEGRAEVLDHLIAAGADVNLKIGGGGGGAALELAIYRGHEEVALALIAAGADVDSRSPLTGESLLHLAVSRRKLELVRALLAEGADPRAKDRYGKTALDTGRTMEEPEIIAEIRAALRAPSRRAIAGKNRQTSDPGAGAVVAPDSLDALAGLADRIESAEDAESLGVPVWELPGELDKGLAQLAAYLEAHPGDARASILSARLFIAKQQMDVAMGEFDAGSKAFLTSLARQHEALAGLLDQEPGNAEAHFTKARLYALEKPVPEAQVPMLEALDLGKAIEAATLAHSLASGEKRYSNLLASLLIADRQLGEALSLLATVESKSDPAYLLLEDLVSIPLPEGTTYLRDLSGVIAWKNAVRGRIADNPQLRVSAYGLPMNAGEFESHCAGLWPGFRFHRQSGKDKDGNGEYIQYLSKSGGSWRPSPDPGEVQEKESFDGLIVTLVPGDALPPDVLKEFSQEAGSISSILILMNQRRLDDGEW